MTWYCLELKITISSQEGCRWCLDTLWVSLSTLWVSLMYSIKIISGEGILWVTHILSASVLVCIKYVILVFQSNKHSYYHDMEIWPFLWQEVSSADKWDSPDSWPSITRTAGRAAGCPTQVSLSATDQGMWPWLTMDNPKTVAV